MKRIFMQSLVASSMLVFSLVATAQTTPGQFGSPFYSPDQFQLAHSLFDKLSADLQQAGARNPVDAAMFDRAQGALGVLEQNWDSGRYQSRQIDSTISAIQTVLRDGRLMSQDVDALAGDLSQLLDFRTEYY